MKTNVAKYASGMLLLGAVATAPAQTAWNFFLSDAGGGNSLLTWTVTGSLATPPGAILTTTQSRIAVSVDAPGIYVDSYATGGSPQAVPTPDGSYFQVAESSVDVPIVAYDANNVAGSGNDSFGLATGGLPSQLAVPGQEFLYHAGTQSALIPIDYSNFNPGGYQSEEAIFSTALTVNLTIGPVPEPPTLALSALSGLCGLLALRRRRRSFQAWLHLMAAAWTKARISSRSEPMSAVPSAIPSTARNSRRAGSLIWNVRRQPLHRVMKKLVISMILLTTGFACFGQVYLTSGESCVFNFTLPYTRAAQGDIPTVTIFFSGGEVGSNWSEMTQFFPDSVSDNPFATDTYTHTGPVPPGEEVGRGISFDPNSPPPWPDLQGVVQVTALSGSFQVDQMFVQEDVNGGYYSSWVYPVPVPEPSLSLLLLLAGALCLSVARSHMWNRQTRAPNLAFAPRRGSGSPLGRGR